MKDTELKDLALTDKERDIARSKACALASGDCNPSAEKSCKEGENIPPKELNSIWSRIRSAWKETAKKNREYRERMSTQNRGLFGGRDLAGRLKGLFGLGKPSDGSGASSSPAGAEGSLAGGGIPALGSYDEAGAVGLSGSDYSAAAESRQRAEDRTAGAPGEAAGSPGLRRHRPGLLSPQMGSLVHGRPGRPGPLLRLNLAAAQGEGIRPHSSARGKG